MFEYRLEHIMSYTAMLGAREAIGPVAEGFRTNIQVTGGEVTGPQIRGKICPTGGDWLTIRRDGVAVLNVRATIETNDGALIYMMYIGVSDRGENGYQNACDGRPSASGTPIHTSPRFHTSHPTYLWLNRVHCLGIGRIFPEKCEVAYNVYAVR